MKAAIRTISCAMALMLVPALATAQAQAQAQAQAKAAQGAKKADSAAMKHDMGAMKHEMGKMEHGEKSAWKELDAFHKHLQDTWHPAQAGDLKPAREKAAEFVKAAEAWQKSKGPESCDNAAVRKAFPGVIADAKAYADVVKASGTDDAVKAALKKAHDSFEAVAMPCMMAGMKEMDHKAPTKP